MALAAAGNGNRGAVEMLLAQGANANRADHAGRRALHQAATIGQIGIVHLLLDAGAEIEARTTRGGSALDEAVAAAELDVVLALLEAGADANRPGRDGLPPLHRAAMGGDARVVLALLNRSAQPDRTDENKGNTALMLAANRGYVDIVRLLLGHDARVDVVAKDGWTALQAAEMIGDGAVADVLRDAGARR